MRVRWAVVVYGGLFLGAILWGVIRGDANIFWSHNETLLPGFFGLPLGLLLASLVVLFTRWSVRAVPLMRDLGRDFRALLGPISQGDILIVAAVSSVGEEAFFRGAMQPSWGLIVTSVIF